MKTLHAEPKKNYRLYFQVMSILLLSATCDTVVAQNPAPARKIEEAIPGKVRIKVKPAFAARLSQARMTTARIGKNNVVLSGIQALDNVHKTYKVNNFQRVFRPAGIYEARHRKYGLDRWYEIDMDTTAALTQAIAAFGGIADIEKVEPVYRKTINGSAKRNFGPVQVNPPPVNMNATGPNDPMFAQQWHYNNTGQSGGTPGVDIDLLKAWKLEAGKRHVVVAVMDGGIQTDHEDLAANMWINPGEVPGNNIDDDNNGFIDDIHGYGFGDNTGTIAPDDHGTHVGGTVAAVTNNGIGVSGVAGGSGAGDGIRLMSCAVFGATATDNFPESYVYAADMGAVISQNSWGYYFDYEQVVLDAIDYFIAEAGKDLNGNQVGPLNGGVVIFSSGNDGYEFDAYPGAYEPVIAVAATTHKDVRSYYSTFGWWVDISAPGGETDVDETQGILSTLSANQYGFYQGTSMACPHVSGVAALLVSKYGGPGYSPATLRQQLIAGAEDINSLQHPLVVKKMGKGRLNAANALYTPDAAAPQAISDLGITDITHTSLTVSWTSPSDPGDYPASYDLRYATSPITAENFEHALAVDVPAAEEQGIPESFTITGLNENTIYYVAIKARDLSGNVSALSNIMQQRTYFPPQLIVTPAALSVNLQTAEKTTQNITLFNEGEAALNFNFTASEETPFATSGIAAGKIASGDSLTVPISIRANYLFTGAYNQNLLLLTNDPLHPSFSIPVQLSVTNNGVPVLSIQPDTAHFGTADLGSTVIRKILFRNEGTQPLMLDTIAINVPFFASHFSPLTLQPFDTASLSVAFTPSTVGNFISAVTIVSNDPVSPEKSVILTGNGYDPYGGISVRQASLQEHLAHGESSSKTLVIRNSGMQPVSVSFSQMNGFFNTFPANQTNARIAAEVPAVKKTPVTALRTTIHTANKKSADSTSTVQGKSTIIQKGRPTPSTDRLDPSSPRYVGRMDDKAAYAAAVPSLQAAGFQFATDFEGYHEGVIAGQQNWYGDSYWTVSSANPYAGLKHLRFNPGESAGNVISPRVSAGSESKSTITMQVEAEPFTRGYFQIIPASPSTGYVVTRIMVDYKGTIQVLVRTGESVGAYVKIPVVLPESGFEVSLEVTRATHEFAVYIEGEQVFAGLGFAGNIEETAFLGTGNGFVNIDNFRIIDGGQEGIPYITLDPSAVVIPAGDSVSVTVNFNTSDLVYGDYTSSIKIKPEGSEAITVPVLLTVTGDPMLAIDNNPMYLPTGKDSTALVMLRNTGGERITYTASIAFEGADTGWLSATIPSGTVITNHAVYLPLKYDATDLDPGEYHATLTIISNAPTLTVPIVFHVTAPGHIVVDPVSFTIPPGDYDQWFTINITNTGESRLIFTMSSDTRLRTPYPYELTPLNTAPVRPGPDGIEAVPNRGQPSPWGNAYDYYFEYFMPNGNVDGADYWGADRENWEGIRPAEYIYYIRGLSDGTGQPSTLFSPIVPAASDNLSTASMHMNLMYSAGTTWQLVAQTADQVVTRLQINPDQTMQILVRDDAGNASFQRLNVPFPKEYFDFKIESDRLTSNFSIFFNGTRVFTGRGFADHIEQLGFLSLMEEAGSAVFFDAFSLYDCPAVVQVTDQFWDEDFLTDTVTRALAPGEGRDMQVVFSDWNLAPGIYQDSLQIASDDPAQPIVHVPYTITVTKPIVPQPDYQVVKRLEVQSDTLKATVMAGEPITVELSIHNPSAVAQSLYYVKPTVNYNAYKAYSHGSHNFEWIDISTTGTKLDLGDDDSKAIQLPFAVFVDPNLYSEFITISSNGYLRVGNVNADSPINRPINSYYEVVENVIAPYWDDLKPDAQSGIYYQMDDDRLIVQYNNIPFYGSTFRNTFQVILRRNSSMKYQYLEMHDQQSASVGMAASAYTYALGLAANEAYVEDSLAVVIVPFFEAIDDTVHGTLYEAYPWIRYPAGESITIPPHTTALLPVRLDASEPGVASGNIILTSNPTDFYDDPYYQADHKDAFVTPVTLTVTDNPPPVISPVEPITIVQGTSHQITFTATDENDSLITFSLDFAPSFATLLQHTSTSATYTFAPGADDIGEYDILVVAKDVRGRAGHLVVHVTVTYSGNTVANFSLINTVTGEVIADFESTVTLDRTRPDFADLNIRANTLPSMVGSVKFKINGSQRNIDGSNPYLLKKGVLATLSGENILLAEPFTEAHGHGQRGTAKTATIIIQSQPAVVSFSLVNVFSNQTLETFTTHLLLDRSHPDFGSFVIRANTSSPAGSVKFRINGSQRNIDNSIPYQLNAQVLPTLPFGDTRLFAQPFSEASGHGERGQSLEAIITLVNGVSTDAKSATNASHEENITENFVIDVYPIPVRDVIKFKIHGEGPAAYHLTIVNAMGQVVFTRHTTSLKDLEISTAALGLGSGVYYVHLQDEDGARSVKKVIKR